MYRIRLFLFDLAFVSEARYSTFEEAEYEAIRHTMTTPNVDYTVLHEDEMLLVDRDDNALPQTVNFDDLG